ncbi:MAG: hypothetical protein KGJ02_00025 [Verrucomicrobiota bacterium]|nr:hypothetical protein [Verrucomicrobiota bacterium]
MRNVDGNNWIERLPQWANQKQNAPKELVELSEELKGETDAAEQLVQSVRRLSENLRNEHVKR